MVNGHINVSQNCFSWLKSLTYITLTSICMKLKKNVLINNYLGSYK